MGSKVGGIIISVAAGALTGGVGFGAAGFTFSAVNAGIGAAISGALSVVSSVLAPKPQSPGGGADFAVKASKQTQTLRQAVVNRRKPVGSVVLGTILTYYAVTSNKKYHHMIMTVCDGPISSFGTIWIGDEPVNPEDIDGSGNVIAGRFSGKVRLKLHLGATDQAADSDLVSEVADVDSNFRGRGVAYIYARIEWDRDILPNGLPGFRAVINASEYDPRTATTGFNDNSSLAWRGYVGDDSLGLAVHGGTVSDVDTTAMTAAANVCDEIQATNETTATVEAVSVSGDSLALTDDRCPFFTGDRVNLTNDGSPADAPAGITNGNDYYCIVVNHARASASSPVRIQFATSLVNARAGTAVTITDAGTGTHTITKDGEPRYRASGMIDTADAPYSIIEDMMTSMVGDVMFSGGKWVLLPGTWRVGAISYDEGDLRGSISGATRYSLRENFNACKGIYASPFQDGEATEYPVITSSTLEAADNAKRLYDKFDQPMTASPLQAQRNAGQRIKRYRSGEQRFSAVFSMKATQNRAGDTILLNNTRRGWVNKPMLVRSHTLVVQKQPDGAPYMAVHMDLQATASTDFDWDPATEETDVVPSVRLTGTGIFSVTTPTLGTLASGTTHLFLKGDGTVISRIYIPWTSITDQLILGGGEVQVRYKKSSEAATAWQVVRQADANLDYVYAQPVDDDVQYDAQIRAVNSFNVSSAWSTTSTHTVIGKTTVPADVGSLSVQQNGVSLVFTWPQVADIDLSGYEIRYMKAPFVWADAAVMTSVTRGTQITSSAVPPSPLGADGLVQTPWVFGIKARDTSENYSDNAATRSITVFNAFEIIQKKEHWPLWSDMRWRLPSNDDPVFDVSDQDGTPSDLFIKPDGQTMYVVGETSEKIFQYSLSTAWDLNSALATGLSLNVSSEDGRPTGMAFSSDGATLFVSGADNHRIYQYDLSIPWTLSSAVYSSASLDFSLRDNHPRGVFVGSDGTEMFVIALEASDSVYRYTLSTAWDLSTASYIDSVTLSSPATSTVEGNGAGLFFKPDGTKLYVVVDFHSSVYQYSLSTAWDLSTVTYDSVAVRPGANSPTGLFIKSDGLRVYFTGKTADSVYEFALNTAWNMSSIELLEPNLQTTVDLSDQVSEHTGFSIVNGGVVLLDMDGTDCYQYTLSSPWNIAAAIYDSKTFDFSLQSASFQSIVLSDDGTKCFALGNTSVYQYTLSTAWDISTASYDSVSYGIEAVIAALPGSSSSSVTDIFIKPDGLKLYAADQQNDAIYQFSMGSAWSLTGASYDSKKLDVSDQEGLVYAVFLSDDGEKAYACGSQSRSIFEYALATPWDISTGAYSSRRVVLPDFDVFGMQIAPDGTTLFALAAATALLYQYNLGRGFVRNPLTGNLNPFDGTLASGNDFNVFNNYVTTPPTTATYEADEVTVAGFDGETRIWADIGANLGPGESGRASAQLQIDARKDAESYDGFANFTTGMVDARYVKGRIVSDTSIGATRLTGFNFVADAEESKQSDTDVAVGGSGTAIVFPEPYTSPPFLRVSNAQNNDNLTTYDSLTTTGFTAYCRTGGGLTTGSINWEATGV